MHVHDRHSFVASHMHCAMDSESCRVYMKAVVQNEVAVEVDLDKVRRGHLAKLVAVGIEQKMIF